MSHQLGDLTLPDGILWTDQTAWSPVHYVANSTLSGRIVLFSRSQLHGRPITLVADSETCWLSPSQVNTLMIMAAQPGATYLLTWGGETYTVVFRHHDPPAIALHPISPNAPHFIGEIRLMEI